LSANKTFSMSVSGGMLPKPQTGSGNWTQAGSLITITPTKSNGVAEKNPRPMKLDLSKDGKTLTAQMPGGQGGKASLSFSKA